MTPEPSQRQHMLGGMRIIESVFAVTKGKPREVPRTWRQRLWSWPWRPWVRTRTETPMVPASYQLSSGTIVAHPAVVEELRRSFPQEK